MLQRVFRPLGMSSWSTSVSAVESPPSWRRLLPPLVENEAVEERLVGPPGLLRAVFLDGLRTYCRAASLGMTAAPEYRDALRWINDESRRSIFSFTSLCDFFDLDASALRRALRTFPHDPDPRLERIAGLLREGD